MIYSSKIPMYLKNEKPSLGVLVPSRSFWTGGGYHSIALAITPHQMRKATMMTKSFDTAISKDVL